MNDNPKGYRYVRMPDSMPEDTPEGGSPVVIGLSTGWVPATVAEDWRPVPGDKQPQVIVRLHGCFQDPYKVRMRQEFGDDREDLTPFRWTLPRSLVRKTSPPPRLELSLLVVRWWDYWTVKATRGGGSRTYNVNNEDMILDVLNGPGSPHDHFGKEGRYQVVTAFVQSSLELGYISASHVKSLSRSRRKAAFYFLWPAQFFNLDVIRDDKLHMAYVDEASLFPLMRRMEDLGIRSMWPHSSNFYRQVCSKNYLAEVSRSHPHLRVPLTVSVDPTVWEQDQQAALSAAMEQLLVAKGLPLEEAAAFRGVAKRGFCWMGTHVQPFTGKAQLQKVLKELRGSDRGAQCYVQERIDGTKCELRVICMRDMLSGPEAMAQEIVWIEFKEPTVSGFQLASHRTVASDLVASRFCEGKTEAKTALELEAKALVSHWLKWIQEAGYSLPAACRFDFLVAPKRIPAMRPNEGGGPPPSEPALELWLVELTECGSSLCGLLAQPRTVAVVNELMGTDAGELGFPKPLPTMVPRPAEVVRSGPGYPRYPSANSGEAASFSAASQQTSSSRSGFKPGHKRLVKPKPTFPYYGAAVVVVALLSVLLSKGVLQGARKRLLLSLQAFVVRFR
eukprot:CAMPEP_0178387544 /NCGR_PEP_ID=MMETSP0689_2-20121128/9128_1 /TAXON_ID=160604 /ORGANISM="Amphidinium massartii, Strain CS-259" /LENGTH=616 /DNA_ID=CAMNT_0020007911 /DNA_START=63 /DNA_END=1910 /DNA_ORIENTATION=+